jgi:glycine/D-amino acid oxidase-like deaminating enzyme
MKSVAIVGAGVIGLFTGWRFACAGWRVTVYERGATYAPTSLAAAGALSPFDGLQNGAKQRLQRQSLWLYPQRMAELGADVGFMVCGRRRLLMPEQADKMALAVTKSAAWTCPQPAQRLVEVTGTPPYTAALECAVTATVDPHKLLAALHQAIARHGGQVVFHQHIRHMDDLKADITINTAGIGAAELSEVRLVPLKKQAITLELAQPLDSPMIVEDAHTYIVPRAGGRQVYVGATAEPAAGADFTPTPEAAHTLQTAAARLIPQLARAKLVAQHVGVQPKTPAGRGMYLGASPQNPRHLVATGHGGVGFGLAPITADCLLALAEGAPPPADLTPFAL